jgi:hypothetical protein
MVNYHTGKIGLIVIVFANGHVDSLLLLSIYLSFAVATVFCKMFSFATHKTCSIVFSNDLPLEVSGFLRLTTDLHLSLILVVVIILPTTTFALAPFSATLECLEHLLPLPLPPQRGL